MKVNANAQATRKKKMIACLLCQIRKLGNLLTLPTPMCKFVIFVPPTEA